MQPLLTPPRDTLTEAAVLALLRESSAVRVGVGAELIDTSLNVLEDISADMRAAGQVSRASYATLHGRGVLHLSRELAWGAAIIRPYIRLSDGVTTARWNLGAYYTATPARRTGESPTTYQVEIYDLLHGLSFPVGESYAVPAGAAYLSTIVDILAAQGYPAVSVDQSQAGAVLPAAKVWPISDEATWLAIINDLLAAVGYQGIWSDWDGRMRLAPYIPPSERGAEWVYDSDEATTLLAPEQEIVTDLFEAPNRWVAVRNNFVDGPPPTEGDGKYTFVNEASGPASVAARGGRVLTRILYLDAADQASLVTQATLSIQADMRIATVVSAVTAPNPQHWHFDRIDTLAHPVLGDARLLATQWTLPLDGSDMSHEWMVIEP